MRRPPSQVCSTRVDRQARIDIALESPALERFFNVAAFRLPELIPSETPDRASWILQGRQGLDVSLQKNFRGLLESHRVQFRWELFNLRNHANFITPNLTA